MTSNSRFKVGFRIAALTVLASNALISASVAQQRETPAAAPLLTRTAARHETRRLGYGSTVTIVGAPQGSITVEGWPQSEVQITAHVELRAETEEDLDRLAVVNGWVLDNDVNHLSILSTGTHDKVFMRRVAKNFPKKLLGLPWKIDYRIRIPMATDLEINAGRGPITLSGVEGAITLTATEGEIQMTLTSGTVNATVASGRINVRIPTRSWRGAGADLRVAAGDLNVELPAGFNGDIDADVLRTGQISDMFLALASRQRPGITERVIRARAGAGGAFFKFTVGDGTIRIRKLVVSEP
ncbi:MAG: DUF4097 family beta strand repeat-containing protein [Acidobacteriota bacterium]|nr:DUF4097 family beta strand repeat-containing protein [Acidobacteriota bacterium]